MEKKYYTFYEIVYGLRGEYLKNQELINELESLIDINRNDASSRILLSQSDELLSSDAQIRLLLYKRQKSIIKRLDRLYSNILDDNKCAYLSVEKSKDGGYELLPSRYSLDKSGLLNNTMLFIRNKNTFNDISEKLYNSKLMQLPCQFIDINDWQRLVIDGKAIELLTLSKSKGESPKLLGPIYSSILDYVPRNDVINVDIVSDASSYRTQKLLETEIPEYKLPQEYKEIIESNIMPNARCIMDYDAIKPKGEIPLSEKDNYFVLERRIK